MQALSTIKLLGDVGVNYDLEPCDLPPDAFTSGSDYILRNGKIQSYTGSRLLNSGPGNTKNMSNIMYLVASTGNYYLAFGTGVYVYNGSTWTNITSVGYPVLSAGNAFLWTWCKLGAIPVCSNPQGYPQYWSPQSISQKLIDLPFSITQTWNVKGFRCKTIRAHKNFLFALGMYEGINDYPNNYRWSTAADSNGIPFTWDETDLSGIAGTASILGNSGPIVDGLTLRDAFCIYSTDSITILDYVGLPYVWKARTLSSTIGLLTANCIAEVNGIHIFLSKTDICINDGNAIRSISDRRIRNKLKGLISSTQYNKCYTVVNTRTREVWFCVPDAISNYPNVAIIYDIDHDKISMRSIVPAISAMCFGSSFVVSSNWASSIYTWDNVPDNWNIDTSSPFNSEIIGIEPVGSAIYNFGESDGTSGHYTSLERIGVVFGDQRDVTTIVRVYPHMQGTSPVNIRIGSQDYVGGPTRWQDIVSFIPNIDRKVDVRSTGKLHCWHIDATNEVGFTFAGMDIEYVVNGAR